MHFLRGLRVQMLLWTILPLILVLVAVTVSSIQLHHQAMRSMVAERDAHLATLAAARVDYLLQVRKTMLETLQKNTEGFQNTASARSAIETTSVLFDRGITLLDETGRPFINNLDALSNIETEPQQILELARATPGKTVFSIVASEQKSWLLLIALTDPNTNRTAVGAITQEGMNLPNLFGQVSQHPSTEAYLVSTSGNVIYHQNEQEIGRDYTMHAGVNEVLRGDGGSTYEQLAGEEEHVVGYAPVQITGWGLLILEPWANVIEPGLQYTLWAPILVLVAAVTSLLAVQFGLGRIIHPLQLLGRSSSRLAWGDFHAIQQAVGGIDEIRDLQATLQEMAAQIHRYQEGMHDYIAVLTQTQEEERKLLARELHDGVAQTIIALGQRVKILKLDWRETCGDCASPNQTVIDVRLNNLEEMVNQCLGDVRGLIRDLRPIYLEELGLVAALEALAGSTKNDSLAVGFDVLGEEKILSREANLAVYRIAQAAVSNAVRHGEPDHISIHLEFRAEGVVLTVEDNGTGFTPPERPSDLALNGHFGLVGMHERATRLGGHLSIRSNPGSGTKIVAFLPHQPPVDAIQSGNYALQ